jgi:hypothetical protein
MNQSFFVLKSTFDFCVHPFTFVAERKALKDVYFAKTRAAGRVVFSLVRAPAHVAPLLAHWWAAGDASLIHNLQLLKAREFITCIILEAQDLFTCCVKDKR